MSTNNIPIRELAHGRAGDKGDRLNVSVIAHQEENFQHLLRYVTEDFCRNVFASRSPTSVVRYVLPNIYAMNFVVDNVLDGGVNLSLQLDRHGKCLSFLLLDALIPTPPGWLCKPARGAV